MFLFWFVTSFLYVFGKRVYAFYLTSSNNVNTLVVSKGLEGEESTEALVKGDLSRVVAKVSVQGLVGLRSGLGDLDVLEGHCVCKE